MLERILTVVGAVAGILGIVPAFETLSGLDVLWKIAAQSAGFLLLLGVALVALWGKGGRTESRRYCLSAGVMTPICVAFVALAWPTINLFTLQVAEQRSGGASVIRYTAPLAPTIQTLRLALPAAGDSACSPAGSGGDVDLTMKNMDTRGPALEIHGFERPQYVVVRCTPAADVRVSEIVPESVEARDPRDISILKAITFYGGALAWWLGLGLLWFRYAYSRPASA